MPGPRRYLVTAALPYANGPIHIGHLAGAYLPADIYVRFLRFLGQEVLFICGSDEHGVPILVRARQENRSPQDVVDHYHRLNEETFRKLNIRFDEYFRTSHPLHHRTAQQFFLRLLEKGYLEEKEVEQLYDPQAKLFLADRYVMGTCPRCGYDQAYGDQCERCGTALSPEELQNPRSVITGARPVRKKTRHWYFRLPVFEPWLRQWILEEHAYDWKPNVLGQCKTWLDAGLKPRAVTRDLPWGVPVPLPETQGKVLYVWFEAPIGYISATIHFAERTGTDWKTWWQDPDTALIHFIGKDNIVFHCLIFPAMLRAHEEFILPAHVPANEFLNLEGQKISTSRNWAVWAHEFAQKYPHLVDGLRFVLARMMPETRDAEFTWADFQERINHELVATAGNYLHRVATLTYRAIHQHNMNIPEREQDTPWTDLKALLPSLEQIRSRIESFQFRSALDEILRLAQDGNRLLNEEEPWKNLSSKETHRRLLLHLQRSLIIARFLEPWTPGGATRYLQQVSGLSDENDLLYEWFSWDRITREGMERFLLSGREILPGKVRPPFATVPDSLVEKERIQLHHRATSDDSSKTSSYPVISIAELEKVVLITGTIQKVQEHPRADRLYILEVSVGERWGGTRTLVAGIRPWYSPADLEGKQVVIVANLEPRKIRGIVSEGMLLAVHDEERGYPVLVSPLQHVPDGSRLR